MSNTNHLLVVKDPLMQQLLAKTEILAKSKANIFLLGESGTGKEVLAHFIHQCSCRKEGPLIKVNCAAIPETLWESEFFGHEKGSFTGALQRREGRFELAHEGTLLLDEISEIPLSLQAKLLRSIQEQEFERVGGTRSVHVDVRIISTSNQDMQQAVQERRFREDLYFRLHVIPIYIPPLRKRKEDIIPLAEHFIRQKCLDNGRDIIHLSQEAVDTLLHYTWPGNVRELANLIERTVILHDGPILYAKDLLPQHNVPLKTHTSQSLASIEKTHILATLKAHGNNKTKAAKALDISVKTLRNKLQSYTK